MEKQDKNKTGRKRFKLYLAVLWGFFLVPFITLVTIFTLIATGKMGFMPTFEDLENPQNNIASQVFSADGELLGSYYLQNRIYVEFDELSENIVNSLLATEDIRFRRHAGVDARGLARVGIKSILLRQDAGGGSTITQQLAKNLFPRDTTSYRFGISRKVNLGITKFKEWVTAVKLERNYTKDEIIVMYLNTVDFGSHSYGIKTAARTFFNTTPDSLMVEEAALLIGVLKAPTWYSPVRNPERALNRRNVVLRQLHRYDFISTSEFDSLAALPIQLNYLVQDHTVGPARHFRERLRTILRANEPRRESYLFYDRFRMDSIEWANNPLYGWVNKNYKPDGTNYNLYRDGLRIFTTIDSRMQRYAEEALEEHLGKDLQNDFDMIRRSYARNPFSDDLTDEQVEQNIERTMRRTERYEKLRWAGIPHDSILKIFNTPARMSVFSWEGEIDTIMTPLDSIWYYKKFLRSGFMAMDPSSGNIRAYVGGPDYTHFKYDHVSLGRNQVGSIFKPFLYTLAMQEGHEPCEMVPNIPQSFVVNDSVWTPRNSGPTDYDGQMVTLKWGLANSVNQISAWLMKRFNPPAVIDVARKMGVHSPIDPVQSVFMGTSDITLYEMVSAFSTYANQGIYNFPVMVTRIEDRHGNVIAEFQPRVEEAISEEAAYLMINLLQSVVDEGTGRRLRFRYGFSGDMAGKTGTTQRFSDGWFIGIVPQLVAGTWTGGEDRGIRFNNISMGQGANMALPIFAMFMEKVYADESLGITQEDEFEVPPGFSINLDCDRVFRAIPVNRYDDFYY
ncbi:MAG: penicillin-binding protein [Marinilabiliales bacterium]|nr:MAG: penicillin-binding protein [Marinilabiliales bacterium]